MTDIVQPNHDRRPLKIAHFGDIHLTSQRGDIAEIRRFLGKRFLGTVNFRYLGRGHIFSQARERFQTLLRDIRQQSVSFMFSSGDFSSMSFPDEFRSARTLIEQELHPSASDLAVIPGNHDRYTLGEAWSRSFDTIFREWLHSDLPLTSRNRPYPFVRFIGHDLSFIFIDVVRFHPLLSTGTVTRRCLREVERLLSSAELETKMKLAVMHYPPFRADGSLLKYEHRCRHITRLLDLLQRYSVSAIFNGHVHENYFFRLPGRPMYLFNAGSGTHSRHSTYNIYTIEGNELTVDRREYNPDTGLFVSFDQQQVRLSASE
ncbi:metallophosphoesterase [bacterium]|nr:metallophosphoesterase [bacterium]